MTNKPGSEESSSRKQDAETQPALIERSSAGQANADLAAASGLGDRKDGEDMEARQEQLIEDAIEETFPVSDPVFANRSV